MDEGPLLEVIKVLYGLPTSRNRWWEHLLHTLREIGFKPARFDLDVWIRGREGGYNYIGTHTYDFLVVAVNPTSIFKKLNETYTVKSFGPPKFHIGCDCIQFRKGATTPWFMGSSTYITECLRKVCALQNISTLRKEKLSCSPGDHPELYLSPLLCEVQHRIYQHMVGMEEWTVQI